MKSPFQVKAEEQFLKACTTGNVEQLKDAVSNGVDIHLSNDYVLRVGGYYGHLENIKFALSITTFGKTNMKTALRNAKENKHNELFDLLTNKIRLEKLKRLET